MNCCPLEQNNPASLQFSKSNPSQGTLFQSSEPTAPCAKLTLLYSRTCATYRQWETAKINVVLPK